MSTGFLLPAIGTILHEKYQVTKPIGAGSFGAIFEVQSLEDGKLYAVKLENRKSGSSQLRLESKIYKILDAAPGIPCVYDFWNEDTYRAMCMDRLGPSLHSYFLQCNKLLSLKTTCMVAIQMICRLEYLHQRSHIHRDIKPDNFVFGIGTNAHILYIIDMGLAQRYRDMKSFVHRPYKEDRGLAGTARYVSVNVHLGVEQSCRDDLESVGYVLISLRKGRLPWQSLKARSRDKKDKDPLAAMKMETSPELLCRDLPTEFLQYIQKVRQLTFDQRPQYAALRGYFISLMVKNNYAFDFAYDWVVERGRRIFDAITGASDQTKVIIPTSPAEIAAAGRVDEKIQQNSFYQPLPFFSIVNEASRFVGMSKQGVPEKQQSRSVYLRVPSEQTMFVLDRRRTKLSEKPFSVDFCVDEAAASV
jgi:serine/threonine protein kinase